jgi:Zn-dependent metalloprotease
MGSIMLTTFNRFTRKFLLLVCILGTATSSYSQTKPGVGIQPGFNNRMGLIQAPNHSLNAGTNDGIKVEKEKNAIRLKPDWDIHLKSAGKGRMSPDKILQRVKKEAGLNNNSEFRHVRSDNSGAFSTTRHQQFYKGIKVDAGEVAIHEKDNEIFFANGYAFDINIEPNPTITESEAIEAAKKHIGAQKWMWEDEENEKFIKENTGNETATYHPDAELVYSATNGDFVDENMRLCYKVNIAAKNPFGIWEVYVDALTAEVINKISCISNAKEKSTVNTVYSEEQEIITESISEAGIKKFYLWDRERSIHTKNNLGSIDRKKAVYFSDDDNIWNEFVLIKIDNLKIELGDWYYSLNGLEIYLEIKDKDDKVVYKSAPLDYTVGSKLTFTPYLTLDNPPYKINVFDYDGFWSNDDLIESFPNIEIFESDFFEGEKISFDFVTTRQNPAFDVHWAMGQIYDYFLNKYNRNSFDNNGSPIISYLNTDDAMENDDEKLGFPNQAYSYRDKDTKYFVFGLGDGVKHNYWVSLDICAHEFSHQVINSTSTLLYQGESGALTESFCDIMASGVENFYKPNPTANWYFGEEIYFNGDAIRSMSDPGMFGQPDTYEETYIHLYKSDNDKGGVHDLNGIPNYWFYLLTVGNEGVNDLGNNYSVNGIGREKSEKIAYNTFTNLTTYSKFRDAAFVSINVAQQLFKDEPEIWEAVVNAWYAVGVLDSPILECGEDQINLREHIGRIYDGSGPFDYGNNRDCLWLIKPDGASRIHLTFTEFSTEADGDSVFVYDGESARKDRLLFKWSGHDLPPYTISTFNYGAMLIRFKTNASVTDKGWSAIYTSDDGGPSLMCNTFTLMTEPEGNLSDGSGESDYTKNSLCQWLIAPPGATKITLILEEFSTEDSDGILIYDGPNTFSPLLGAFTGKELPKNVTAASGEMLIVFITNNDELVSSGWKASYTSEGIPQCKETQTLTKATDVFSDGSEDELYQNNLDCYWRIEPPGATSIRLNFTSIDLEMPFEDQTSYSDYIEVYDGTDISATLLVTIGGTKNPGTIVSTGGSLLVRFKTDYAVKAQGWTASYTSSSDTRCSGTTNLYKPQDTFSDGSGEDNYGNNSDCRWLIKPEGAISIILNFDVFDLEELRDYVTIYDGETIGASVLAHFTRNQAIREVFSSGGAMLVRFRTNETGTAKGWKASYTSKMTNNPGGGYLSGFEYWFDNDYSTRRFKREMPSEKMDLSSSIATEGLSPGIHTLHFRFRDNKQNWSSVNTHTFYKLPNRPESNIQIVGYEYWFDSNYSGRKTVNINSQQSLSLDKIDVSMVSPGFYQLHIRYLDDAGRWSSVNSSMIQKLPVRPGVTNRIAEYRYWIDNDVANMQTVQLNISNQFYFLDKIVTKSMFSDDGYHYFHYQFKDLNGKWSAVTTVKYSINGMIPSAPIAQKALLVTTKGFLANWLDSPEGLGYSIDISTSPDFIGHQTFDANQNLTYTFQQLLIPGFRYYYRVAAYNQGGQSDFSNVIEVTVPTPDGPFPTATNPTNIKSNIFTANWETLEGAEGYVIDVSTDNHFNAILPGYYNLSVGNATSFPISGLIANTTYYYRVRAILNNELTRSSNTIEATTRPLYSAEVTYPSTEGIVWEPGFTYSITWQGFTDPYVRIELLKGNTVIRTIASSRANSGSMLWKVASLTPGNDYRLRITSTANPTITDVSDFAFAIQPALAPTVTYPSASSIIWNPGTIYTITWKDFSDPYVRIELLKGGTVVRTIASSRANTGSMNWNVASTLPSGNDYKIRITSTATPAMTDMSDNNFTIQPLSNPVVTYPSATDILWNPGTIYEIIWQDFTDPYVRIELLKGSAVVRTITTATANDGSMLWKVAPLTPGNDYRIRITSTATPAMTDISDNLFSIQPAASPMVTYPSAAGIVWVPGTIYEITWENYTDPYVRIELLKGGTIVRTVASARTNSGSMNWRAPALESGNDYRIRITSTATPTMTDESDNNFRLSGPPQVTYPSAAGIVWEPGTIYEITWQDFTDPYVKIELLKGGSVVRTVTTATSNDGTMLWRAPAITPGNDYKIQITSTATPTMTDLSDNNFSIAGAKSATIADNDPGWNDLMIYPNPFTDRVTIGYSIAEKGRTLVEIFDLTGRRVTTLQDALQETGTHELQWDATDASGQQVISGIYLCRIQSGGFVKTEKLVFYK